MSHMRNRFGTLGRGFGASVLGIVAAAVLASPAAAIELSRFDVSITGRNGDVVRQAGARADINVGFEVPIRDETDPLSGPIEQPHRLRVDLPPGIVGNPGAIERCPTRGLKAGFNGLGAICPVGAQIGIARVPGVGNAPIYNVVAPPDKPAVFAFNVLGAVIRMVPRVRPDDYGITIETDSIPQAVQINGADVQFWGVPADPSHDPDRYFGTVFPQPGAPSHGLRRAFMSLSTDCSSPGAAITASLDGWRSIGSPTIRTILQDTSNESLDSIDCEYLEFLPSIDVSPNSRAADAPTGLEVDLRVPQNDSPDGLAAAHVKDVAVALPVGMSVSPASASGLGACSPSEIGLGTDSIPTCPQSSKLGTVTVETPLLEVPLAGDVILASPDQNPFGSLVALYIVAEGSGVRIKLPGRIDPNPVTGQLTATFTNNPQLPFSALKVRFDGGENAPLATPTVCGTYEAKTKITSWSGKSEDLSSPMVIDRNCGSRGVAPAISAGSVLQQAAKDSAFVLNLDRPDGQQNYGSVAVRMPPGLLARISDIGLCAEADAAAGSCSANSLIGNVTTTAGPGSAPLPVRGKAYLTGPYKGGPYGISIVVPTAGQAGPFDLGNVVVRARINVDRTDAHVTVTSDPMPTILRGFPLRIRQVQVAVDHGRFMLNPSSCKPMHVGVTVSGTEGGVHEARLPYQVSGCGDLKQDQKISIGFTNKSQQRPGRHPGVEAKLTSKGPGVANLAKVVVKLPLSVALDPKNAKALCKPEQRAALNCPADSIVGRASAKSVLKEELTGPVYFVEGTRKSATGRTVATLPKLWIPLSGGGVTIDVNADSDVSRKQLVSTFKDLPDAPLTEFNLRLNSGKNGILTVPPSKEGGTCQRDRTVAMQLTGQNGAVKTVSSQVKVAGCKAKKSSSKKARAK